MNTKDATPKNKDAVSRITATWLLSLKCTCPNCEQWVDLMDFPDFWDGRKLEACENGTERSHGVEVNCPKCQHEFVVDLVY